MSHLFCLHAYCILLNHDCIHATISISFRMQRILLSPFRITIFSFYVGHQTGGKWPQPSFIQIVFVPLVQVDVTGSGDSNIDPQHLWTEILFLETIIMTLRCDSWRKSRIQLWILICDNLFDEAIQCFLQLFFLNLTASLTKKLSLDPRKVPRILFGNHPTPKHSTLLSSSSVVTGTRMGGPSTTGSLEECMFKQL